MSPREDTPMAPAGPQQPRLSRGDQSSGRPDGGYVGSCTGCHSWYWNSWGHGTYCGSCLYGYSEALKDRWNDAETRYEQLLEALRPFVDAYNAIDRLHCPEFNGPAALAHFERAAEAIEDAA